MNNLNPFAAFRQECHSTLAELLIRLYPDFTFPQYLLNIPPPSPQFGDLTSPVCFELAKKYREAPAPLAHNLAQKLSGSKFTLVEKVEALNGYLNFFVDLPRLGRIMFDAMKYTGVSYGFVKFERVQKVIVEHTSANPSGPLHAGTARNAILGDTLARILQARGHEVRRHFYVDDVGRQVAMAAYGFRLLGEPKVEDKPDAWIGFIYTATNCAITVKSLKAKLEALGDTASLAEASQTRRQLDEYTALASELISKRKDDFYCIFKGVEHDADPEKSIEETMRLYEAGDPAAKRLVRKIVRACLRGIKQTLKDADIEFDSWDWESDLVWTRRVEDVLRKLEATPYVSKEDGALTLNVEKAAQGLGIKDLLLQGHQPEFPPLVLMRRDGTTLYTTRDIAYHLEKFKWANRAINVIGVDQTLAQIQLKVALILLGLTQTLDSLCHYAYEMVRLPGYKMSRRRGKYVTFDEMIEEAVSMAHSEVAKRVPQISAAAQRRIAKIVGLGAIKYAMLSVSASKTLSFDWARVLNFEMNSSPFIQYAHARACSILRKAGLKPAETDTSLIQNPLERQLTLMLARFPEVFVEVADSLKPELLVEYGNNLAMTFNAFYRDLPVIKAGEPLLRDTRLALVDATRVVLANTLGLLGIQAPERM